MEEKYQDLVDLTTPKQALDAVLHGLKATRIPFPYHVLPKDVSEYILNKADTDDIIPEFAATVYLTAVGAIVGNRASLSLISNWTTYGTLWAALIAAPGKAKSPSINCIMDKVKSLLKGKRAQWYKDKAEFDATPAPQSEAGRRGRPTVRGYSVPEPIFIVDNTTIEAVTKVLSADANAMLLSDELSTWFQSMTKYKKDAAANDSPIWNSLFNNSDINTTRSGTGPSAVTTYITNPSIPVVGAIPPVTILGTFKNKELAGNGFLDRILLINPVEPDEMFTYTSEPDIDLMLGYEYHISSLFNRWDTDTTSYSTEYNLSTKARDKFKYYLNKLRVLKKDEEIDALVGVYPKMEIYLGRFAFVLHMSKQVLPKSGDVMKQVSAYSNVTVSEESVDGAWELVLFFIRQLRSIQDETRLAGYDDDIYDKARRKHVRPEFRFCALHYSAGWSYSKIAKMEHTYESVIEMHITENRDKYLKSIGV